MNKLVLLTFIFLTLSACQIKLKPNKDEFGIYRTTRTQEESPDHQSLALRDDSDQLVTSENVVNELLEAQKEGKSLLPSVRLDCPALGLRDNPYESEVHYNKALRALKSENWKDALDELENAKSYCEGFEYQSGYHYLRGLIFLKQGKNVKAKEEFKAFLQKAERIEPMSYSGNNEGQRMQAYAVREGENLARAKEDFGKARQASQSWLDRAGTEQTINTSSDFSLPAVKDFITYPDNGYIKPGGTRQKLFLLWPTFGLDYRYSMSGESYWGLAAVIPADSVFLIPRYYSSSLLGTIYGLTLRYPFYESKNRDLIIEVIGHYSTARRGTLISNGYSTQLINAEDGSEHGVGLGATKRLTSRWSVSAQGTYQYSFARDEYRTQGTAFGSFAITQTAEIYSGYIQDDFQTGISLIGIFQIGYNFRHKGLSTQVLSLSF